MCVQSPAMAELVVAEKLRLALLRERVQEIGMHVYSYAGEIEGVVRYGRPVRRAALAATSRLRRREWLTQC
jgi:hypothetical protein